MSRSQDWEPRLAALGHTWWGGFSLTNYDRGGVDMETPAGKTPVLLLKAGGGP